MWLYLEPFLSFAFLRAYLNPEQTYLLIIEELNRANAAAAV
jgi:hypothetical protein